MKNFSFFIALFSLILTGCDNKRNQNEPLQKKEVKEISRISGKWGALDEPGPVWDIRKDSIYYYQNSKTYEYKIVDNNMHINFEKYTGVLYNVHVNKDTLFFFDSTTHILMRAYRFK